MGWYIGNNDTPITTNFQGGFSSNEAYLSLSGEYYYNESKLQMIVSIAVYRSLSALTNGDNSVLCTDLNTKQIVLDVPMEEIATVPLFQIVVPKMTAKIYELVPAWTGKLYADF